VAGGYLADLNHNRGLKHWLRTYGRPEVSTPDTADTLVPTVMIDDISDSPDALRYLQPRGCYNLINTGGGLTHIGFIVYPGPEGTYVDAFGNAQNGPFSVTMGLIAVAAGAFFPTLAIPPGQLSNGPVRHRIEYGHWLAGSTPLNTLGNWGWYSHGARLPSMPSLFIPPELVLFGCCPTVNAWANVSIVLRDVL